jgi:hypothetical protein
VPRLGRRFDPGSEESGRGLSKDPQLRGLLKGLPTSKPGTVEGEVGTFRGESISPNLQNQWFAALPRGLLQAYLIETLQISLPSSRSFKSPR